MPLRSKNAVVLAKIEDTPGTENTPSASTDAILVERPSISFNPNLITTDEVTGSLDGAGSIIGGMFANISFPVLVKGSGAAGTAPEFGSLLKACGFAETVTDTAVPAAAEACGAGGSTTVAQLGSSASATASAYQGMPVTLTETVAGSSFIAEYDGSKNATLTDIMSGTIDATTDYQIPVNVLYSPGTDSIPALTMYIYMDGILYKFVGCRGSMSLAVDSGGVGRMNFTFNGMFLSKTDATVPTAVYDNTRPPVFKNAVFKIQRGAAAIQNLSFDLGNNVGNPDNPNALEGFDPAEIRARNITGSINPLEVTVATRNAMADFRAGTKRIVHARWGETAGNRVGITIPEALYTNQTPGDRDGDMTQELPFEATGQEDGVFLCFY